MEKMEQKIGYPSHDVHGNDESTSSVGSTYVAQEEAACSARHVSLVVSFFFLFSLFSIFFFLHAHP